VTQAAPAVRPGLEEVRELAATHDLVAVYRSDLADTETPVAAYWRLNEDRPGFLLESVEGGERLGRYSFIGGEPLASITMRDRVAEIDEGGEVRSQGFDDPVEFLEEFLRRHRQAPPEGLPARFSGGLVGYMAYEAARYFEKLPAPTADPLAVEDAVFFLADNVVVFDHLQHRRTIISHVRVQEGTEIDAAYAAAVERVEAMAARLDGIDSPPGPAYGRTSADPSAPPAEDESWNLPANASAGARNTSSAATSSRSKYRAGSGCRCRRIRSTSTGCCAPSTPRRICTTCACPGMPASASAAPPSWGHRPRYWCGSRTARSNTGPSPGPASEGEPRNATANWRPSWWPRKRSAPST